MEKVIAFSTIGSTIWNSILQKIRSFTKKCIDYYEKYYLKYNLLWTCIL